MTHTKTTPEVAKVSKKFAKSVGIGAVSLMILMGIPLTITAVVPQVGTGAFLALVVITAFLFAFGARKVDDRPPKKKPPFE